MDAIPVSGTPVPQNPANEKVTAHSVQRGQFSGFPLTKLPSEVLVNYLLPCMSLQDVSVCSRVNTRFREMIEANDVKAVSFCRNFCSSHITENTRERYHAVLRPWLQQFGQSGRDAMVKLDKKTDNLRFPQLLFYAIAQTLCRAERFAVSRAGIFSEDASTDNLIFSPDGMHAVSRLSMNGARLYRLVEGKWQSDICIGRDSEVEGCGFSADSSQVVTVSSDLWIRLHKFVDNYWQEQPAIQYRDGLDFAALSSKCQVAVSGSYKVFIYGYDGARWQQGLKIGCDYEKPQVIFSANGKHVLLACKNLSMYELVDGTWQFQKIVTHFHQPPYAIFSADGNCLLTHSGHFEVKIHHLVAGQWQESKTHFQNGNIVNAIISQDCHHVMLRSLSSYRRDNLITFLCCVNGTWQVNTTINHHSERMTLFSFSPDSVHATTGCDDKTVRIYQQADGVWQQKKRIEMSHVILYAQFSPYGNHIVVTTCDKDARIYGLVKGHWHMKCRLQGGCERKAKFSPTGVYLSTNYGRKVNFWMIKEDMSHELNATASANSGEKRTSTFK